MNDTNAKYLRWQLAGLIVFVYAISFFLPAVAIPGRMGETRIDGRVVDRGGELVPPVHLKGGDAFREAMGQGMAVWFANPVLWLGCVLLVLRRWLLAALAGTVALVLAVLPQFDTPSDPALKFQFFVGYWTWLTSAALLALIGWIGSFAHRRSKSHRLHTD
jgi:hypothetical protein